MTDNPPTVVDRPRAGRFELQVNGEVVGLTAYRLTGSELAIDHTVIDRASRAVGSVRPWPAEFWTPPATGPVVLAVLPLRPRHPAYLGLVPDARRAEFGFVVAEEPGRDSRPR